MMQAHSDLAAPISCEVRAKGEAVSVAQHKLRPIERVHHALM